MKDFSKGVEKNMLNRDIFLLMVPKSIKVLEHK